MTFINIMEGNMLHEVAVPITSVHAAVCTISGLNKIRSHSRSLTSFHRSHLAGPTQGIFMNCECLNAAFLDRNHLLASNNMDGTLDLSFIDSPV